MKIKEHHGWAHGLPDNEDRDINCIACRREAAQAVIEAANGQADQ